MRLFFKFTWAVEYSSRNKHCIPVLLNRDLSEGFVENLQLAVDAKDSDPSIPLNDGALTLQASKILFHRPEQIINENKEDLERKNSEQPFLQKNVQTILKNILKLGIFKHFIVQNICSRCIMTLFSIILKKVSA